MLHCAHSFHADFFCLLFCAWQVVSSKFPTAFSEKTLIIRLKWNSISLSLGQETWKMSWKMLYSSLELMWRELQSWMVFLFKYLSHIVIWIIVNIKILINAPLKWGKKHIFPEQCLCYCADTIFYLKFVNCSIISTMQTKFHFISIVLGCLCS